MKTMKYYTGISLLATLLLFSGCGKELDELPAGGSGTESPENPEQTEGELLRLRVSDAGYLDADAGSRATDSGLSTTFEDGDKIGLFVVNNENEVLYANVPYTKSGEEWTAEQNVRTKGYPVRVFAYYPYVENAEITEKVDVTAQDASDFFKTYIEGLDISNQSTPELYRQADVMACMVTIDNAEAARKELTLSMSHLMGLVMVKLPETVTLSSVSYYLEGDESYKWTVRNLTLPANLSDKSFTVSGIQPLKEDIRYRYLCRSGDNNISFSGGFKTYGATKSYTVSNVTVAAGSSKTYNVSVIPFPIEGEVKYTLQVGDFYMKDGSILSSISEENKADCIGIVFWLGDPTATDPVLKTAYPNCTHGIVISLKEVQNIDWQVKYERTTIQSWAEDQSFYTSGGYKALDYNIRTGLDNYGEIQGYNNTKILEEYNQSHSSTYPVTILSSFSTITSGVSLPEGKTSEWYLPSPKELAELYNAKNKVNNSLSVLGCTTLSSSSSPYWSSAESAVYSHSYYLYLRDRNVGSYYKSSNHYVRLALAF